MQTNGWDTVYALSLGCLNQSLADQSAGFPNQVSCQDPGSPFSITAQLGAWQVSTGSTAQFLDVSIPIVSGVLDDTDKGPFPLAGISVTMRVALEVLSQGGGMSLRFNLQAVTPIEVVNPGNLSDLQQVGLLDAIAGYLSANSAKINYEFASISVASHNAPAWLTPLASNYTTLNGFLVILCSTTSASIASLPAVADPSMLAAGDTAAFLLSGGLFLANVVLPGLAPALGIASSPAPFIFDPATLTIKNNGEVDLSGVKQGLITYKPKLTSYRMNIVGNTLVSTAAVTCSAGLGVSADFTVTCTNTTQFNASTQTLSIVPDPKPVVHKDAKIPWYELELGIVFEILVPILASGVASATSKSLSSMRLAGLSSQSVAWTAAGNFKVTNGGIANAVYLQGAWG